MIMNNKIKNENKIMYLSLIFLGIGAIFFIYPIYEILEMKAPTSVEQELFLKRTPFVFSGILMMGIGLGLGFANKIAQNYSLKEEQK